MCVGGREGEGKREWEGERERVRGSGSCGKAWDLVADTE